MKIYRHFLKQKQNANYQMIVLESQKRKKNTSCVPDRELFRATSAKNRGCLSWKNAMMSLKEKNESILDIWNILTKNLKIRDSEDRTENAYIEVNLLERMIIFKNIKYKNCQKF